MAEPKHVQGIDHERVSAWLTTNVEGARGPFTFDLIAGGRSNLTFKVTSSDGVSFALRRPPISQVLSTAHDMLREHRVLAALGSTGVPVPRVFGVCEDESVNERPFYVMEFVDGMILRSEEVVEALCPPPVRPAIGRHLASTLAALHRVDPDEIGLGTLGRKDAYVERQLKRWSTQFDQMVGPDDLHADLVRSVNQQLSAQVPDQQAATIVHGDFRLDNTVLDDAGRVKAILDWELCTLGDPLADLALLMVYWAEPGDAVVALEGQSPTLAPGFGTRAEIFEEYERQSDLDLSGLPYYTAFSYWRLACILQGVYRRYQEGASAGDDSSVDAFPEHIGGLARAAQGILDQPR